MAERRKKTTTARADGLVNAISGLGSAARDKRVSSTFQMPTTIQRGELDEIYRGNGIGRRIVDLPIHEMTREWFEVDGDPEGGVLRYLEDLHAKSAIQEALRWGDLYGGSLVVLGLDDGGELKDELKLERLDGIRFFHVYDRWQVTWTTGDLYTDANDERYGLPMRYQVSPYSADTAGGRFTVHETRTLRFDGAPVPPFLRLKLQGWGDSVLQAPYEQLREACAGHAHAANLIEEWAIGVVTIKNLIQLLSSKDGEAKVRRRLEILDLGKSILRSMLLAEGETFEKKTQSVAGLAEVLDRQAQALSAATGIPVSLLFGEPPSGLQATGAYNQANWYDEVKGRQEAKLQPQLERLVEYVFLSDDGPTGGIEPENWSIRFRPLWQMTPQEEANLRNQVATTDAAYINTGVLEPEEVAVSRFGGDRWSMETVIDEKARERPEPETADDQDDELDQDEPAEMSGGNGAT